MKITNEMLNDAGHAAKLAILSALGVSPDGDADTEQSAAVLTAAAGMALSICRDLGLTPVAFFHVLKSLDDSNRAAQATE